MLELKATLNNWLEILSNTVRLYHVLIPVGLQTLSALLLKYVAQNFELSNISIFLLLAIAAIAVAIAARTISWFVLLKKFPLSLIYPFSSLNLVLLMFFGWLIFNEQVTLANILGSTLIIVGISMIYLKR